MPSLASLATGKLSTGQYGTPPFRRSAEGQAHPVLALPEVPVPALAARPDRPTGRGGVHRPASPVRPGHPALRLRTGRHEPGRPEGAARDRRTGGTHPHGSYGPPTPPDDSVRGTASALTVHLDGEELLVAATEGQTILNAVRAAGALPPYSCESGVCGACRAHLNDGSVHLRADGAHRRRDSSRCHTHLPGPPYHPPANRRVRLRRQRTWAGCNSMPEDDAAGHVLHTSACVGEAKVSDAARRPHGKTSRVQHPMDLCVGGSSAAYNQPANA